MEVGTSRIPNYKVSILEINVIELTKTLFTYLTFHPKLSSTMIAATILSD